MLVGFIFFLDMCFHEQLAYESLLAVQYSLSPNYAQHSSYAKFYVLTVRMTDRHNNVQQLF